VRAPRLLALLFVAVPLTAGVRADDDGVPVPGDDFVVTGTVKIRPGTYRIADKNGDGVIRVKGDGTKLDLTGVTLNGAADDALPDTFAGVGVSVDGAKGASITGGSVRGFKIGVRVHDSPAAKLSGIDASGNFKQHLRSTVEREDESDWLFGHENDDGHWERDYGAGISLRNSPQAVVERCTVRSGQNGVLLDRCDKAQVFDGTFSFNSGWGIALWRTCDATICRNSADYCVRGYSHGRYARGQDSAGILVFEQCSRNTFARNSATHGGDGFFLYAGNETLKKTGEGGCNDNVVYQNDFSHAVANGIEATFSRGNRFAQNYVDDCEHGVWAGYSYDCTVLRNEITHCRSGISIEHGHGNRISENFIDHCGIGVHLWWDVDQELFDSAYGRKHDLRSTANRIEPQNSFRDNDRDVVLDADSESVIEENIFEAAPRIALLHDAKCRTMQDRSAGTLGRPAELGDDVAIGLETRDAPRSEHADRDRRAILVDDWGPIPPTETRLFPATIDAVGVAKLSALGVDKKFEVTSLTDGFVAEPMSGDLPATIAVRRKDGGLAPKPFEIVVKCGDDVRKARGTVASMPWDVRFYKWTKDPREDADAWKALLATEPVETRRVDGLDFAWNAGAVSEKVGADRFGTLATCEVETTAGKWRLATVSDDGIRVWVDGKLVVDDWTHHGPTPHDVDLDLAAGKHAIRVEHFEIDGWAALRVSLAPAAR
jgi:parallel beta-helix repeat protein